MSDLNTEIKIGADASGVEAGVGKAKRSLKDLGDAAQKAGKDAGAGIGSIGAGGDKAAKDVERATKSMQGSLQRLLAEQKAGAKGSREYYEALADTRGISRNAIKPILDQIDAAKAKTLQAKTAADSWTASLGKVAPLVAAAFSGAAITGFLGKVVSVQREFDVLNSSLKTVTGSSAAAEREMAWLKDFAKETPFGLAQATQGFVKMKALGLDPTRAALTSFGNTASAMGKDLNQMIEAVADASTGEFERLKEFGIKAKKEGDNVSLTFQGVTTTIKNSAAEITQYLENIGNVSFGGAMEERAKTLDGTIAALGDTWDELFRTVSTNNVGGLIFDSVTLANGVLEDATTILRAMGGAASETGKDLGILSAIQNGIATVFETVAVLGVNLKYVLVQIGTEIGGLAAQVAQAAQFNFSGVAAIRRQMVADAEAARKEIDATTARILNARKAQEEYARYATRNASAATDPRRVDLGGSTPRATGGVSSGTAKAVKETISEYDKLIKKLSDELPRAAAEAEAAQMGYNKSQTEFLALAGSDVWAKFSNSERARVASLYEGKIASEQAGDAAKELSKAYAEAAAERIKTIQSMERAADGLQSQNDALREEIELIGLSTEQQTLVLQQRNDAIILTKEATLAELERQSAITGTQTRVEIALASEIDALKERNALLGAKGVKNAAVDAAKTAKDEWQKTTDSINQSLTDSLMRGFESGKDFAKNLRDTVVNMFKTMVLRPVISAIINPISQGITGMMGLSGAAQAGQALGGASSLFSAGSALSGLGAVGGALSGFTTAATASIQSLVGMSGTVAQMTTSLAAAGHTAAAGVSAGVNAFAAIPGWGWAIAGIAALGAIFSKKSTPHAGAASTYSEAGGLVSSADVYQSVGFRDSRTYKTEVEQVTGNVAKAIGDTLNSTAKAFGKTAGYEITTAFADDTSKDGAWGSLMIRRGGESVIDWRDTQTSEWAPKEFADGEAGSKEYLAAVAKSTRDALVGAIGEVDWATDMLTALGESPTIEGLAQTVAQINAAQAAFENLGKNLVGFGALTDGAISALIKAAGSIEGLVSAANTYYDNFYSEAEKAANVTRDVTAALADVGLEMPKTRDEFRALVEAQMALGEAGAPAVAALLGVSGAFAAVTPVIESAIADLVASVGIDAKQISTTLRDGLLGRISGEEMGEKIGTMITGGINNAIAGGFADQITQIFMQGIVNPVIQAAMTGSSISAAVSQASIDAMVQQANAAASAIGAIMNDPGFQAAMAQISAAIGSLTTASSVGYRAPIVLGGGGNDGGSYSGSVEPVEEAWKSLLESIVGSTLAAQTELSRLGMTSYERALAEIDDKANDLLKQIGDDRGFAAKRTELTGAEQSQSAFSGLAASLRASIEQSGDWLVNGGTAWASDVANQYQQQADAAAEAIARLKAELTDMPEEVRKLIEAEKALLEARNGIRALEITGDLRTDIERLGMTDMERTLAGIGDKARDYIKSLEDIGQATKENIDVVGEWEKAMRLDAIKKAWEGVSDSMLDEIDRIRGSLSGDGGLAALQTEFAINTAAARAGDKDAAGSLAGLSRDILRMQEGRAGSAFDWARIQAQMLASLEESARIAALMGRGLPLPDGPYRAGVLSTAATGPHGTGEFISYPAPYGPPPAQQSSNVELIAEIRLLNKRLETLEANTQATALHTQKTSKALERAMPNGDAIATREVTA